MVNVSTSILTNQAYYIRGTLVEGPLFAGQLLYGEGGVWRVVRVGVTIRTAQEGNPCEFYVVPVVPTPLETTPPNVLSPQPPEETPPAG
jgi:hypothetical protein